MKRFAKNDIEQAASAAMNGNRGKDAPSAKTSMSDLFYLSALFLVVSNFILRRSMLDIYLGGVVLAFVSAAALILLVLSEATSKVKTSPKTYLICLLIVAFGTFQALITDTINIFFLAVFIAGARKVSLRSILKCCLLSITICCLLIIGSSFCGITYDYVWAQGEGRIRHGLGFNYATFLPHYIFFGVLMLFYLKKGRFSIFLSVCILAVALVVYYFTDTRNAFFLTLIVVVCALIPKKAEQTKPLSKGWIFLWTAFIPVVAGVSIAMMVFYTPTPFWDFLNDILSHRLSISHRTFEMYGFTWFGQDIDWRGNGLTSNWTERLPGPITYIDNSFANIFMRFGAIAFVLVVSSLAVLLRRYSSAGNRIMLFVFAMVTINAFIDSFLLEFQFDAFILALGTCLLCSMNKRSLRRN